MGVFSNNCEGCGHPLLSKPVVNQINSWMNDTVTVAENGDLHFGSYDGYGRVGGSSDNVIDDATCWHRACWEIADRPVTFTGASEPSEDQGWFFDDGDHDLHDPRPGIPVMNSQH